MAEPDGASSITMATLNPPSHCHLATTLPPSSGIILQSVSVGDWKPDCGDKGCGLVYLTQQKGKHWSLHGHVHQGRMVLLPEEALFLMECGALQIMFEGKPFTLQEAYYNLLSTSHLLQYQVYASLKRIGFIAMKVRLSRSSSTLGDPSKERLTVLRSCPLCPVSSEHLNSQGSAITELLEVYKPSGRKKESSFKKSQPGPPHFRVLIVRADDEFPSLEEIEELWSMKPLSPLRICVVDGASQTYYTLSPLT